MKSSCQTVYSSLAEQAFQQVEASYEELKKANFKPANTQEREALDAKIYVYQERCDLWMRYLKLLNGCSASR